MCMGIYKNDIHSFSSPPFFLSSFLFFSLIRRMSHQCKSTKATAYPSSLCSCTPVSRMNGNTSSTKRTVKEMETRANLFLLSVCSLNDCNASRVSYSRARSFLQLLQPFTSLLILPDDRGDRTWICNGFLLLDGILESDKSKLI